MVSNEQNAKTHEVKKRRNTSYWMEEVDITPDLILRYQMETRNLEDILQADLRILKEINQV